MNDTVERILLRVYGRVPKRLRRFAVHRVAPCFSVGAICVIERDDGSLLLLRNSYRRGWGLPGGLLRRGESAEDAAHREVREEIGIEVELRDPPLVVVDPWARRVDVVYRARTGADDVKSTSPEVVEARWFPRGELPDLQEEIDAALTEVARADGWPARGDSSG